MTRSKQEWGAEAFRIMHLVDVLPRIDTHPVMEDHLLMPKHWKVRFDRDGKNAS
ncbi:MAG: hypothetical protein PHC51_04100 [bacterium]|nr:hypothetical protein [bacterium]